MNSHPPRPPKGTFSGRPGRNSKGRGTAQLVIAAAKRSGFLESQSGTFAIVPVAVVRDKRLGRLTPRDVLIALCRYRNSKTGLCWPSLARLAADLAVHPRTVQRHIKKLIECSHVLVEPGRRKQGGWGPNWYRIVYRPLQDQETALGERNDQLRGVVDPSAPAPSTSGAKPSNPDAAHYAATPVETLVDDAAHYAARDAAQNVELVRRTVPHEQSTNRQIQQSVRGCEQPVVALPARAMNALVRRLAPTPPRDPLGDAVRWLAETTGQHPGPLWTPVQDWHDKLCGDGEASDAIVEQATAMRADGVTHNLLELMTQAIANLADNRAQQSP
jgi:helix-turn-helix protein